MSTESGRQGESEKTFSETAQRQRLGKMWQPSTTEVSVVMSHYLPRLQERMSEPNTIPNQYIEVLRQMKEDIKAVDGVPPSRPSLAARVVSNMGDLLNDLANNSINQGNLLLYVFFYDTAYGISVTVNKIGLAEGVIRHGIDTPIISDVWSESDELSEKLNADVSAVRKVDVQLHVNADLADAVALLKEDPTGFLLVEEAAKRLKRENSRFRAPVALPAGCVHECVARGATLAEQTYKTLYNLTGKIT